MHFQFRHGILTSLMNNSVTMYRVITAALVLAVIAAGIFLFARRAGEGTPPDVNATATEINPASTTISKTLSGVTGTGEFKVALVSSDKLPPAPDFHAPIKFSADMTPEVREAALGKWLARRGFNPDRVDPQRDFKVPDFFLIQDEIETGSGAPTPPLPPVL